VDRIQAVAKQGDDIFRSATLKHDRQRRWRAHARKVASLRGRRKIAADLAERSRTDPSFVTQLIATAESIPQTCALRRATSTAYRSTANRNQMTVMGARMRQIA
jgi:hypothetical protein